MGSAWYTDREEPWIEVGVFGTGIHLMQEDIRVVSDFDPQNLDRCAWIDVPCVGNCCVDSWQ